MNARGRGRVCAVGRSAYAILEAAGPLSAQGAGGRQISRRVLPPRGTEVR